MDGEITEGVYQDAEGKWVRVEQRHYPKTRWVIRAMSMKSGRMDYADTLTPDLTPEKWAELTHDWLVGKEGT